MQEVITSMSRWLLSIIISAVFLSCAASAQNAPVKSPFGVPVPAQSGPAEAPPNDSGAPSTTPQLDKTSATSPRGNIFDRAWSWLLETQSRLNKDMATAVKQLKSDNPLTAALTLIGIAFAYGVLHAAGPGHGKAIISSYVLANEQTVRRGIALSFLAALFQALSAILFVGILAIVLNQTSLQMRSTEATIETLSWGLVAAVGAYLLWRQISPLISTSNRDASSHVAHRSHDHNHDHGHHHEHGPNCGCGHSHMPSPKDLQGEWSWKSALAIAASVGIRPCTGAILILIFALSQGMLWAGVLGTFAMALGTAITVSILAAMAVGSRNWAERASGPGSVWASRVQTGAGILGAALVFGLGSAFFVASLNSGSPF
jgi:nickel/cobalt exporter